MRIIHRTSLPCLCKESVSVNAYNSKIGAKIKEESKRESKVISGCEKPSSKENVRNTEFAV